MPEKSEIDELTAGSHDAARPPQAAENGPLFLEGWLEFNERRWGVTATPQIYGLENATLPSLTTMLYLDAKRRVLQTPSSPYLPAVFRSSPTDAPYRLYRQWLQVIDLFAADLSKRAIVRTIGLPPEIVDVRPLLWRRFSVSVRYTVYLNFPYSTAFADHSVRKNARKATEAGYTSSREMDVTAVYECLKATEARQGFSHQITHQDLELIRNLMGDEHCRVYVARTSRGEPAAARVVLHQPGNRAIDWVAGTVGAHLRSGVTQQLIACTLADLEAAGATGFDFAGANHRNVAAAKASWGGVLTPYYVVEAATLRAATRALRDLALGYMPRRSREDER